MTAHKKLRLYYIYIYMYMNGRYIDYLFPIKRRTDHYKKSYYFFIINKSIENIKYLFFYFSISLKKKNEEIKKYNLQNVKCYEKQIEEIIYVIRKDFFNCAIMNFSKLNKMKNKNKKVQEDKLIYEKKENVSLYKSLEAIGATRLGDYNDKGKRKSCENYELECRHGSLIFVSLFHVFFFRRHRRRRLRHCRCIENEKKSSENGRGRLHIVYRYKILSQIHTCIFPNNMKKKKEEIIIVDG